MAQELLKNGFVFPLVFEHSVEGILVTNNIGEIILANPSCLKTFGYTSDELYGKPIEILIPKKFKKEHEKLKKGFLHSPESRRMASDLEIFGLNKSGKRVPLEISLSYAKSELGLLIICFIVDVSSKKRLELELRKERDLIQQYLDVTDSIFLVLGKDERIIMVNQAGSNLLGLPIEEIQGKNWFDEFIPAPEREFVRGMFIQMMNGERGVTQFHENYVINKEGELRLIEWQNTLLRDRHGQPGTTLSSGLDITEKRALETKLKEALIVGQENERRRIARELHDGLGQSISAIALNLNALEPELKKFNEKFSKIYGQVKEKLAETIEEVRTISHNLTPQILEDYGLERALDHLCETIDESTDIPVRLHAHGEFDGFKDESAIGLYRMIQESLNNALRHGNPTEVNVHLTRGENEIIVIVEDDGQGFDVEHTPLGLGISNMMARADLLKGEVHFDSNAKSGTTVSINIPI